MYLFPRHCDINLRRYKRSVLVSIAAGACTITMLTTAGITVTSLASTTILTIVVACTPTFFTLLLFLLFLLFHRIQFPF